MMIVGSYNNNSKKQISNSYLYHTWKILHAKQKSKIRKEMNIAPFSKTQQPLPCTSLEVKWSAGRWQLIKIS